MNLVVVPFHDWRKILLEGFRTRDAHFIEEFRKRNKGVTLVINRPTTPLEINFRRKSNLIKGEKVLTKGPFSLYKYDEHFYLIDYVSYNMLAQVLNGYEWFMNRYASDPYIDFINISLEHLGIANNFELINQNIFAHGLSTKLKARSSIFDGWDNFAKFEVYKSIRDKIVEGYKSFGKHCDFWITNSNDNIEEFKHEFGAKEIHLVKNGVDLSRFVNPSEEIPNDLKSIKRPIVGFGGKITHLIDVDLINETMRKSPDTSFVFVGQMLDKDVYQAIDKRDNFYYLGDKHYDNYPDYVKNFDICIVPYVVEDQKKSGANTIKVYEYLTTGKKVVGTYSNGLEDLVEHVYIVENADEFAREIQTVENQKTPIDLNSNSWNNKAEQLYKLIRNHHAFD